jgi:hypothetical protein
MRNRTESLLRNKLSGYPANPIGLVLYSHQSVFQGIDELLLPIDGLAIYLFGKNITSFFKDLEWTIGIVGSIIMTDC